MKKFTPKRTEFYENAFATGYYGSEDSGLTGLKDNVRKYWEDVFIKLTCRPIIENLFTQKDRLRILELGSGGGNGIELLTQIPTQNPKSKIAFVMDFKNIDNYTGLEFTPDALTISRQKYTKKKNIHFEYCNPEEGLPASVLKLSPFDLYFSSYGSLSHFDTEHFKKLIIQIIKHAGNGSVIVFEVNGKFSPSWPKYWKEPRLSLPYTMSYLNSGNISKDKKNLWLNQTFWRVDDIKKMLIDAGKESNSDMNILFFMDRSIFVGRHIDTGIFSTKPLNIRYQVNRLLDKGFRGEVEHLIINLEHLAEYQNINEKVWERLCDYQRKWNRVIYLLDALMHQDDIKVKNFIENTNIELMSDDLKLLTWLFRNSDRFPVVDFWASIIGPQVAVILRNIEMSYTEAVGCGHSLICVFEINK